MKSYNIKTRNKNSFFEVDILNKELTFFKKKYSSEKKEKLYTELSLLLSAGIDLVTALDIVISQEKNQYYLEMLNKIKNDVVLGKSFSDALFATGKFNEYEYYSLKIGEESGNLELILVELSKYYSEKIKLNKQFVSSLSYPALILFVAFSAVVFMLNFIVPLFEDLFKRFNGELPQITKLVISLSSYSGIFFLLLLLSILLFSVIHYTQRKKESYREKTSRLVLKVPVIGTLIRKIYLARFSSAMYLLLNTKVPLVNSLRLVKLMIDYYPINYSLNKVEQEIISGSSFYSALKKHTFYDLQLLSLIKVAEEVNQLDLVFNKLKQQYSAEVEHSTKLISTLLEPIIIIVLGLLISIILISMYLPLFKLSSSLSY